MADGSLRKALQQTKHRCSSHYNKPNTAPPPNRINQTSFPLPIKKTNTAPPQNIKSIITPLILPTKTAN